MRRWRQEDLANFAKGAKQLRHPLYTIMMPAVLVPVLVYPVIVIYGGICSAGAELTFTELLQRAQFDPISLPSMQRYVDAYRAASDNVGVCMVTEVYSYDFVIALFAMLVAAIFALTPHSSRFGQRLSALGTWLGGGEFTRQNVLLSFLLVPPLFAILYFYEPIPPAAGTNITLDGGQSQNHFSILNDAILVAIFVCFILTLSAAFQSVRRSSDTVG